MRKGKTQHLKVHMFFECSNFVGFVCFGSTLYLFLFRYIYAFFDLRRCIFQLSSFLEGCLTILFSIFVCNFEHLCEVVCHGMTTLFVQYFAMEFSKIKGNESMFEVKI